MAESTIVDVHGKPALPAQAQPCPQCGAPPDKRKASAGFGAPHPLCGVCGYEWRDEVWRG